MIKDDISKKRKLPTIDHGIDIIGDEWDEEINTDILQNEEDWENEGGGNGIYNSAQMLNGDTISQIGKKHQKKKNE